MAYLEMQSGVSTTTPRMAYWHKAEGTTSVKTFTSPEINYNLRNGRELESDHHQQTYAHAEFSSDNGIVGAYS